MNEPEHVGPWNIQDLGLILAANSSPVFDPLMKAFREAEKELKADEPRVRRLPKPWLGDEHHQYLRREYAYARVQVLKFLLSHKDHIIINGR